MSKKILKNVTANWKTSVLGVIAFASVAMTAATAILDNDPATVANWNAVVQAFMVMVALFVARDGDVTSEKAGAK